MSGAHDNDGGCDCIHFDEGDWVVSRLNNGVIGIVVGEADFGRYYNVQLVDTLEVRPFHAVTLRHLDVQQDEPSTPARADDTNVVQVDFTKGRPLTPKSDTEGVA